jgi:hypothetical protein
MRKPGRKKLIILLVVCFLISCVSNPGQKDWPDIGVHADAIGITKNAITECCFRGLARSIQLGNFGGNGRSELAVVPQTGVVLFDPITLEKIRQIDFNEADGVIRWFGVSPYLIQEKGGGFLIALRGGGYGDVGLLDESGNTLWIFKPSPQLPPNGMVVDDTKEGEPHFFVCDWGALYRLDKSGKVVWKIDEDADYIDLVQSRERSEAGFATAANNSKMLKIWSSDGTLTQQIDLPFNPDGISFVSSGTTSGFVVKSGTQYAFVNDRGSVSFVYANVGAPIYHGPIAKLVNLSVNEPPVLAISSASSSATGRSVLTILSIDGTQLYQEYLGASAALGVIATQDKARERLLVAEGVDKLWIYEKIPNN